MGMSIKLIATDLDGTLLNEKGEVSALTRKVFFAGSAGGHSYCSCNRTRSAVFFTSPGSIAHGYVRAELLYCAERCANCGS